MKLGLTILSFILGGIGMLLMINSIGYLATLGIMLLMWGNNIFLTKDEIIKNIEEEQRIIK